MVVVDGLDEGLDAATLLNLLLAHAAGHLQRVALDAGDEGIGERVRLGAGVVGLDDDDLLLRRKKKAMSANLSVIAPVRYPAKFASLPAPVFQLPLRSDADIPSHLNQTVPISHFHL